MDGFRNFDACVGNNSARAWRRQEIGKIDLDISVADESLVVAIAIQGGGVFWSEDASEVIT